MQGSGLLGYEGIETIWSILMAVVGLGRRVYNETFLIHRCEPSIFRNSFSR
jgi:hypothetical protein